MKKKIGIIYEKSKKIGYGHYSRSLRLKKILKKKYKVEFIELKKNSELLSKIKKKKYNLNIFDLKKYPNIINKIDNVVIFEDIEKKFNNIKSINPLDLHLKNSGPEFFLFPESFFNKKEKKFNSNKIINLLVIQGKNDSNNQLKNLILFLIKNKKKFNFKFRLNIKSKRLFGNLKVEKINYLPNLENEFDIYKNIDFAISGVGNTAFELGYLGIPTIHYTVEKREIKRAKIFQKLKLAPYIKPNNIILLINKLNKFYIDDKYRKKIIFDRIKFFRKKNKIKKIIDEII